MMVLCFGDSAKKGRMIAAIFRLMNLDETQPASMGIPYPVSVTVVFFFVGTNLQLDG